MVIGHHYHLDHAESMMHGINVTHGEKHEKFNHDNIPYQNKDNWGMEDHRLEEIGKNTWEFQDIS